MTIEELYEWMATAPAVGRLGVVAVDDELVLVLSDASTEDWLEAVTGLAKELGATMIGLQMEAWSAKIYPGAPYIPPSSRGDKETVVVLHVVSKEEEIIGVSRAYEELGDFQRHPDNHATGRTQRLREALRG